MEPARLLAAWHAPGGELVDRGGAAHPVVIEALAGTGTAGTLAVHDREADIDGELAAAGEPHLRAVAEGSPGMHDGPVLVMERLEEGVVHVARSGYFAMVRTCDALMDELERLDGREPTPERLPMRARAHELAGGRPLASGTGRAAALGISAVVTIRSGGRTGFVIGRRRADLAADPGKWHVVPSGMLEPSLGDGDPLADTTATELREELGADLRAAPAPAVMGVGHDLRRLRPEVCLRIDAPNDMALPDASREFDSFEVVPLEEIPRFWERHGPDRLTPAAAAAVALLEATAA